MSLLDLPEPPNWPTGGRRLFWLTMVFVVYFFGTTTFAVRDILRGEYLSAFVSFGFELPFMLALVAIRRVASGRTVLRATADSTGTTLCADHVFSTLILLAFASIIPVGLVVMVFTLTGDLQVFGWSRGQIAPIFLASGATIFAVLGLISAARRGGVGYVKFTPAGIEIADILRTKTVAWRNITAIDDHSESKKTRKAIVLTVSDGTELVIDGADFYVPSGVGLYWMVRHYLVNAIDRAEFVDDRSVQRLSDGGFDFTSSVD